MIVMTTMMMMTGWTTTTTLTMISEERALNGGYFDTASTPRPWRALSIMCEDDSVDNIDGLYKDDDNDKEEEGEDNVDEEKY